MWIKEPLIIIDHSTIEEVYRKSIKYLNNNGSLKEKIAKHLWAYHEIGSLIPQTIENFMSGHYFPYSEAYVHIEKSYQLCLEGFYTYAYFALRRILELNTLYIYFAIEDKEFKAIRPWLVSKKKTPSFRSILRELEKILYYNRFNKKFDLNKKIYKLYSELSDYTHIRGIFYSSRAKNLPNFNIFSEDSLFQYCNFMFKVVRYSVTQLLLKYPIGLYPIPLDEKFGLNIPIGGFLQDHQTNVIFSIIPEYELNYMKKITNKDTYIIQTINYFESLEDLTQQEWEIQLKKWEKENPSVVKNLDKYKDENNGKNDHTME